MKNKKLILLIGCLLLVLVLITPVALFNPSFGISTFFEQKQQKLDKSNGEILVETKEFTITEKDFIDYIENLSLVH